MKSLRSPRAAAVLAALALAAAAGGTALASEVIALPELRPPLLAPPPALSANAPALQVAIDSATGLLRLPTPGERLELAALALEATGVTRRAAAAAAAETQLADGTVAVAVDPELHSLSTVTVTADGQVHYACGDASHAHTHPVLVTAPAAEDR